MLSYGVIITVGCGGFFSFEVGFEVQIKLLAVKKNSSRQNPLPFLSC